MANNRDNVYSMWNNTILHNNEVVIKVHEYILNRIGG